MHCRRYHNIHCLWNSRFVPCAFDYDAERGLLLHTPTFSARLGADGLETFSLFFYSSLLFFFFFKDRDWRCSVLNPRLHCNDCKEALTERVDLKSPCDTTVVQNIILQKTYIRILFALQNTSTCLIVGVEERRR